jgi:hypothetical protein
MTQQFQAGDRVLVLEAGSYSASVLREWARALTSGVLVGLGEPVAIGTVRRELADCENVLFVRGSREEIPWRDAFFTAIVDMPDGAETPDMQRVLHPSGRIYSIQP